MFRVDGVVYHICTWIYQFAFLNILFLISCIPIITIFPAAAATFGVVREWVKKKDSPIFSTYLKQFKENFKQSFITGIVITTIFLILFVDYYLLTNLRTSFNLIILSCMSFAGFCFIVSVMYVFPLMVNSQYSFKELMMNSFKIGLYKIHLTIINSIFVLGWLFISFKFSYLLVFFFFSISAYITYWIANVKFSKITNS
jgi:uncharacterized membrane protein YesL